MLARPIRRYERDVLEAIDIAQECRAWELPDLSGWPTGSTSAAITRLKTFGAVYKAAQCGRLTEPGKIALAIIKGKETRSRSIKFGSKADAAGRNGADAP